MELITTASRILRDLDEPLAAPHRPAVIPDRTAAPAALSDRERLLRSLLLDARDAMVRQRIAAGRLAAANPPAPPAATDPAATATRAATTTPYDTLRARLAAALQATAPAGSWLLVVSRGDQALLDAAGASRAWHFPAAADGGYAGHHPADSAAAIAQLEELRGRGAGFFVLPETARWWLDHYRELAAHLDGRYRRVVDDPQAGVVFDLRPAAAAATAAAVPAAAATAGSPAARTASRRAARATPGRRPFAAATIISRNYLSQARVLAESFLAHEPTSRFYLLVVDRLPAGVDAGPGVEVIDPESLAIPNLWEMCFKYGIVEFNTAVKPYLLAHLMRERGEDEVVYLDPDILVMRPLDELREALAESDIVLTPHITRPVPVDGKRPSEQDIMISGAYNLGFIALRRSAQAEEMLAWWQERLQDGCRIDVKNGLFTDQKWIDLAPSLFPGTATLRDPTYNVAFWNLHERTIERDGDGFRVNGRPAAFFHISGFDPQKPDRLSKHQTRTDVVPGSPLAALLERYAGLLMAAGHEETSRWAYGYDRFANGIRVHPLLRQIYLNLGLDERRRFGDPFATDHAGAFLDWATRPRGKQLSVFLETLYSVRYDLPLTFPDVRGRNREGFLNWARRWGSVEMKFEPELVRDAPPEAGQATATAPAATNGATAKAQPAAAPAATARPSLAYEAVVERIRNIAGATLPAGSRVLVVSKGDYRLVDLGGAEGWHFPQTADGVYGGFHPPDSDVAIAHLEALRDKGADYLLLPQASLWWLEYYEGLRQHLESRYRLVVQSYDTCWIWSLRNGRPAGDRRAAAVRQGGRRRKTAAPSPAPAAGKRRQTPAGGGPPAGKEATR